MSAYLIVCLEDVQDEQAFAEYRRLAGPTLKGSGAIFRTRNGPFETLEGKPVQRVIIVEFPSMEAAKAWYFSSEYQEALKFRRKAVQSQVMLANGE